MLQNTPEMWHDKTHKPVRGDFLPQPRLHLTSLILKHYRIENSHRVLPNIYTQTDGLTETLFPHNLGMLSPTLLNLHSNYPFPLFSSEILFSSTYKYTPQNSDIIQPLYRVNFPFHLAKSRIITLTAGDFGINP